MTTWTLPKTKEQALKLKALLDKPLKAGNASEKLYDLIRDDDLSAAILRMKEKAGPEVLVNDVVVFFVEKFISAKNFVFDEWTSEALDICMEFFMGDEEDDEIYWKKEIIH